MKIAIASAVAVLVFAAASSADAKGCIKGAMVGGVAGHFVHHGWLGAAAGCLVGRHEANKHARQQMQGSGSSSDYNR